MIFNVYVMSGEKTVAKVQDTQIIPIIKEKMPLYLANSGDLEQPS